MIGQRIEDLPLPVEIAALWREQNRLALQGATQRADYDMDSAGVRRHYENIVAPVKVDETIIGIVGMAIDVTQRKQAEEELRLYREHLEELVASRTAELKDRD